MEEVLHQIVEEETDEMSRCVKNKIVINDYFYATE